MSSSVFQFKKFEVEQKDAPMKIGTDGILLGAWAPLSDATTALDVGTGNGLIALMLAQRLSSLQIDAIEIDGKSYQQALENFEQSVWNTRLAAINGSIQNFAATSAKQYDLIVSNPPFFTGGTFSYNENRNNVRHTVKLPMGDLLLAARRLMHAKSKFCLILPHIEGLQFMERAAMTSLYCTACTNVRTRANKPVERLLMQFECGKDAQGSREESELIIYKDDTTDAYSEMFIELTKDFYLNM